MCFLQYKFFLIIDILKVEIFYNLLLVQFEIKRLCWKLKRVTFICWNAIIFHMDISRLRLHLRLLLKSHLTLSWKSIASFMKIKLYSAKLKWPEWYCQLIEIIFFYNITVNISVRKAPMLQSKQGKFQSGLMPKQQGNEYQYVPPPKVRIWFLHLIE